MPISSGIYGLAGVVIGGVVTGGVQWATAARTEHLTARVARRQVRAELQRIQLTLERVIDTPATLESAGPRLRDIAQWQAHSDHLARALPDDAWEAINSAYNSLGGLANIADRPVGAAGLARATKSFVDEAIRHLAH